MMKRTATRIATVSLLALPSAPALAQQTVQAVPAAPANATAASPDGRLRIELSVGDALRYTVRRNGVDLLAPSPMGLFTSEGPLGSSGSKLSIKGVKQRTVDESWRPVAGKSSTVRDRFSETVVTVSRQSDGLAWDVVLRAYDDGVAFRLVVPETARPRPLDVLWETTGFWFPADYPCWAANQNRFEGSHENEYDPVKVSMMRPSAIYDAPLLCTTLDGKTTFGIVEADKKDYAGAYFQRQADGRLGVNVALSPRIDNPRYTGVANPVVRGVRGAPMVTPWRALMVGDSAGKLIESNLINQLATPSKIPDTGWIKPGKAAWDWYNGYAVDVPNPGTNTATYKAYIDFAARMGLDYVLIDEGWYKGSSEGTSPADVTVPTDDVDLPGIIKYAAERKVGVWVWLQWKQLERQLDPALALYASWGVKGIKVDFMDRNDQQMVDFYHELLEKTARHKIMVDLHGAYPPDGLARTWPHYLTQEGVLGAEYNKFGSRITATHNVTLPFTRGLLGPMDYTPGGFRAVPPAEMGAKARSLRPLVQTTRGHGLAMYVVYDSPFVMLSDSPDAYVAKDGTLSPGADFLKDVPVTWDETRFLAGEIGQYVVVARRKGRQWYVGAMTGEQGRKVPVPLAFLGGGRWSAKTWQDGTDMNALQIAERPVTAGGSLTFDLAGSGGAVAVLTPRD